jgi:hypothetical protein
MSDQPSDQPVVPRFDKLSMLVGVVALISSGLFFLDRSGAVQVDEVITVASIWVGLAVVWLGRAALRLRAWMRPSAPG